MIKLAIFDLDNTLSESRQKISPSMANILQKLLDVYDVAIISGGTKARIEFQVIHELPENASLERLTLLPQCGTSCFQYIDKKWKEVYSFNLADSEKEKIHRAIAEVSGIEKPPISFPPLIEDKGGEITYSPVGSNAPKEIKESFDADYKKRINIIQALKKILPDFEMDIGGLTSIDITKHGMDKSFGVKKILELKNLKPEETIFVGDALFEGGNDLPACLPGAKCIPVKGPSDTEIIIDKIIKGDE